MIFLAVALAVACAPGQARPDWWHLAQVAQRMGHPGFDWADEAAIFAEHAALSGVAGALGTVTGAVYAFHVVPASREYSMPATPDSASDALSLSVPLSTESAFAVGAVVSMLTGNSLICDGTPSSSTASTFTRCVPSPETVTGPV